MEAIIENKVGSREGELLQDARDKLETSKVDEVRVETYTLLQQLFPKLFMSPDKIVAYLERKREEY